MAEYAVTEQSVECVWEFVCATKDIDQLYNYFLPYCDIEKTKKLHLYPIRKTLCRGGKNKRFKMVLKDQCLTVMKAASGEDAVWIRQNIIIKPNLKYKINKTETVFGRSELVELPGLFSQIKRLFKKT